MFVPYDFGQCIVCKERVPGDPEHVIPEVIGGRLTAKLLCDKCNHEFGSAIVSKLKTDASIRLAVENLRDVIPDFSERFLNRAEYVARAGDGSQIRLTRSSEGLRVLAGRGADDSIVLDTEEALGALATKLRRAGLDESGILELQDLFLKAGEDELVHLPTNDTFVKRLLPSPVPHLGTDSLDERFWALLALEFIALIIGRQVLRASLDSVRGTILGLEEEASVSIAYYSAGSRYDPFHVLRLVPGQDTLTVEIRLFRWLVTHVNFERIAYEGPRPVYLEDLVLARSYFALDADYAEENRWMRF